MSANAPHQSVTKGLNPGQSVVGDDLARARQFVDAALDRLSRVDVRTVDALSYLDAVADDAGTVHARAVVRAVAAARREAGNAEKFADHVHRIRHLVALYAAGLSELEPETADKTEANVQTHTDPIEARFAAARESLRELTPHIRPTDPVAALQTLMRTDEIVMDTVDALASPQTPTPRVSDTMSHPTLDFDLCMPALVDALLDRARQCGKSLSVSYAVEGARLSARAADRLRSDLENAAFALIDATLETPQSRRACGLPGGGRLDITIRGEGVQSGQACLRVVMSCAGSRLPPTHLLTTDADIVQDASDVVISFMSGQKERLRALAP